MFKFKRIQFGYLSIGYCVVIVSWLLVFEELAKFFACDVRI